MEAANIDKYAWYLNGKKLPSEGGDLLYSALKDKYLLKVVALLFLHVAWATPLVETWVKVIATTSQGCTATDSILIKKMEPLFIPNAITPETADQNAFWAIKGTDSYPDLDVKVLAVGAHWFTSKEAIVRLGTAPPKERPCHPALIIM